MTKLELFAQHESVIQSNIKSIDSFNLLSSIQTSGNYMYNNELLESSFNKIAVETDEFKEGSEDSDLWDIALRSTLESLNYSEISRVDGETWQESLKRKIGSYSFDELKDARSNVK